LLFENNTIESLVKGQRLQKMNLNQKQNVYQPKVNIKAIIFRNVQKKRSCEQFVITFFDPMIYLFAIERG
jgi:hypothetical protein